MFMKSLLREGHKESALAIKSMLVEVCRQGGDFPGLRAHGTTKNMFRLHVPAVKTDETYLQGFRVILIVMKNHILVMSIDPAYA